MQYLFRFAKLSYISKKFKLPKIKFRELILLYKMTTTYVFRKAFHLMNAIFLRYDYCIQDWIQFGTYLKFQSILRHSHRALMMRYHFADKIAVDAIVKVSAAHFRKHRFRYRVDIPHLEEIGRAHV